MSKISVLGLGAMGSRMVARLIRRVLAFDQVVALRCARLHAPEPRAERDAIIAATALAHGMTVVTRNVKDFEATGVPLLNPWKSQP
jgi:hypothetical protein